MILVLIALASFAFMEFIAWSNHKFVMHGFLWKWHKDHHVNDHKKLDKPEDFYKPGFEMNDLFFLVYAIPAIILLLIGLFFSSPVLIAIGVGISAYGLIYFIIHDVMIHRRLNIPFLFQPKNKYLRAVIKAHIAHHRGKNVRDFHNYGLLLFFQFRFLKNE